MDKTKNNILLIAAAFIFGGLLTYFITDYIRLKQGDLNRDRVRSTRNLELNDPFSQMDRLHQQMQNRMNSFFSSSLSDIGSFESMVSDDIKVEEFEDDKFKYVNIITDGIDKDSLKMDIANGMISISGQISKTNNSQSPNSTAISSFTSSFARSFTIPDGVAEDKVVVDTDDDKIIIKFPKVNS
ncbi:Hsp20 family protein [Bacteriovorax sp. Seq25_V]|uniref:Hsp20 family protein n=1 Tax=Bacteriovorax sp. Seq25_V TaxID=1201288 RepID=UPI00038A314D|nr:Hsp20 family protein [Bacteriovorax sp. Seq25_V]EQC47638.1 Hsp20/alpha crystallin family protein [Bacteriovorax sp. Seq25_V]